MVMSVVGEQELLLPAVEAAEHFDTWRIASQCQKHSVIGVAGQHTLRSLPQ